MTKYLIVNADGFGFTEGCNRGIFEVLPYGIVTSVSVNMNFEASSEILKLQREFPEKTIGIHLNPIVGPPVSDQSLISSLVNPRTGEFWGGREFMKRISLGRINVLELEWELDHQIKKALDLNIKVSHLDSHQNKHLHPFYFYRFIKLSLRNNIFKTRSIFYYYARKRSHDLWLYYLKRPNRLATHAIERWEMRYARKLGFKMADRLIQPDLLPRKLSLYHIDNWILMMKSLPEGISEIVTHPAYPDETLRKYAAYFQERDEERRALQSPLLREVIEEENIKLISYNGLQ